MLDIVILITSVSMAWAMPIFIDAPTRANKIAYFFVVLAEIIAGINYYNTYCVMPKVF